MSPRTQFRQALAGPDPVFAPLTLDPLTARMVEQAGFGAGYLSGGALGFQYAVGEALLTVTEVADAARRLCHKHLRKAIHAFRRNDYGKAFGTALGPDAKSVKDADKVKAALEKAAKEKSSTEGKTFGDLIKEGKLPGKNP